MRRVGPLSRRKNIALLDIKVCTRHIDHGYCCYIRVPVYSSELDSQRHLKYCILCTVLISAIHMVHCAQCEQHVPYVQHCLVLCSVVLNTLHNIKSEIIGNI